MRNSVSIDGIDSSGPPQFVVHPVGQLTIAEGEPANITARVRPAGDSTLIVEWYKNGKPLPAGMYLYCKSSLYYFLLIYH